MKFQPYEQLAQIGEPYSDYFVTSMGRVFSRKSGKMKELKTPPSAYGYPHIGICVAGKQKTQMVHILVAEQFIGPRPKGYDVCHNDGNPLNNNVENLRYDTRAGNHADKVKHGTTHRGEQGTSVKLTEDQVLQIRALYAEGGYTQRMLAKQFEIGQAQISYIINRLRWTHI